MVGDTDYEKYDLTRLRAELEEEREMKDMLEESVSDLRSTLCELQDRLHCVDGEGEGNEWKTRYEIQIELNGQLGRQITIVNERLEALRGNPMDRLASIRSYDDMTPDTLKHRLSLLSSEKSELQSKLLDCHIRIEQEAKAFHKTNDERRAYLSEIAKQSSTLEGNVRQYYTQPQAVLEKQQKRKKQSSRKPEAAMERPRGEVEGEQAVGRRGGNRGKGMVRNAAIGSRFPTLKHQDHGC